MVKKLSGTLITIFCLFLSLQSAEIKILKETSSSIRIALSFTDAAVIREKGETFVYFTGLQLLREKNSPLIPYTTYLVSLPAKSVSIKVLTKKEKKMNIPGYSWNKSGADQSYAQKNLIEAKYQGVFRGRSLFSINIFPVRVNINSDEVTVVENITFEILAQNISGSSNLLKSKTLLSGTDISNKLFLNRNQYGNNISRIDQKQMEELQPYRSNRIKLVIDKTGMYKVTYQDLLDNEINPSGFNTRRLRLTNRGREIPICFEGGEDGRFDNSDYFEFWGEKNLADGRYGTSEIYLDPFSDENVYWLEQSDQNGIRLVEENGALLESNVARYITPYAFNETIHFEEDNFFEHFGQPTASVDKPAYYMDHWYYDKGITAQSRREYKAYLPNPLELAENSVFVTALFRGKSYRSPSNPILTHQVDVWLNNEKIGSSGYWPDQSEQWITNKGNLSGSSQANLVNGDNGLQIIMNQQNVYDVVMLNWFEISYQRLYRADKNFIKFKKQDGLPDNYIIQFEVDGFTSDKIEIYKLGVSKIVAGRIDYPDQEFFKGYRISFQDQIYSNAIEYVALTEDLKMKPVLIKKDIPWKPDDEQASLLKSDNVANYLIITHELFYENCLELKKYRETSGLKVEVVKVGDIYDEFNYGIKSPIAIKKFLKYVYENWNQAFPLTHVVLIGDASSDYKNGADYVPTILYETYLYGAAASDYQYTLLDEEDEVPDLVIGRIPVTSNDELLAYMEKLKSYETPGELGPWNNTALFISGNDENTYEIGSSDPAFRAQNQRIIDLKLPEGMFVRKLNTVEDESIAGGDPDFGSTTDLVNYFDEGLKLVNFFGHGGGGIWADVQLLNLNDIDRFSNNLKLPFVKSMTCFTGAFEGGSRKGLAEKMVVSPEKGAIGAFASSGLGWLHNDFAIGWTLTDFLLTKDLTVGEAVLFTKLYYLSNNLYVLEDRNFPIPDYFRLKKSMVNQYNLLGDPYVKLSIPPPDISINIDNSIPDIGDTINIMIKAPFPTGTGNAEITTQSHDRIMEENFSITNSQYNMSFRIPENLNNQSLIINAYATDATSQARGVAKVTINKIMLDSIVTIPARPVVGDTISIHVYCSSPSEISRMYIENLPNSNGNIYSYELKAVSDRHWVNRQPILPYTQAGEFTYTVNIEDISGKHATFGNRILNIFDTRPDLIVKQKSLKYEGDLQIGLSCLVSSVNTSQPFSGEVYVFADHSGSALNPIIKKTIQLTPEKETKVHIPLPVKETYSGRIFVLKVDPLNVYAEANEKNNGDSLMVPQSIYNIPYQLGSTNDGVTNDTLALVYNCFLYIPPEGLSASTVLTTATVNEWNIRDLSDQPGFYFIPFTGNDGDSSWIFLEKGNSVAAVQKDVIFEVVIDTINYGPGILDSIALCRYEEKLKRWIKIPGIRHGDKLQIKLSDWGNYALFSIHDNVQPAIEITADGRNMYDKIYIARKPRLAFILQDENGIDLSGNRFQVFLDDTEIPEDALNIPDTTENANTISILTTPEIQEGSHTLLVKAVDVNGNSSSKSVIFNVTEAFDIDIFGNYPNPFTDQTTISYENRGQPLSEFKVKIYTISGMLIREITSFAGDDLRAPGYHEIEWYGRDDDGNLVANGVYFCVIKAVSSKGEVKEKILKIAKLQ